MKIVKMENENENEIETKMQKLHDDLEFLKKKKKLIKQ